VITYYNTIAGHAISKNPEGAKQVKSPVIRSSENCIFEYEDLNSARAGIIGITNIFKQKRVAIVGMGGSGSYLLDFIAKTPVAEIHLYDDDIFSSHNAFRAPGAAPIKILEQGMSKTIYLSCIYANMHRGIIPHIEKITEENITELFEMDMVFICVDSVRARNFISRHLMDHKVPFIDSGLGLLLRKDGLAGQIRVTTYDGYHEDHIADSFGKEDIHDDIYASNIQVAELNCLAAVMMLIRWKRQLGFYTQDTGQSLEDAYNVGTNKILSLKKNEGTNPCIC
ncbi:MAG: ThiF family adenylyltransferase, partial [Allobaculum sp.]|nr:ThiF family adenylyltransferase [Allobaculum sp.]